MSSITVSGQVLYLDEYGFLLDYSLWNINVAIKLAKLEAIELTKSHIEVIEQLRTFYVIYEISPNQRPFVKYIAKTLGIDKGKSIYLMQLFGGSPAKTAAKIAGLPKPSHCF